MYTDIYLDELVKGAKAVEPLIDKLRDKNILITGASGVIGREISDVLLMANKVYGSNIGVYLVGRNVDKLAKLFTFFEDNNLHFLDYSMLDSLAVDIHYIIHLASVTSSKMFVEQPVEVLEESYSLTRKMLDFARNKNVDKFLYTSSVEVYGTPSPDQKLLNENIHGQLLTTNVRNSYPEAKRFCESLTVSYAKEYGLNAVIARPAKVFSLVMNKTDKRVFVDFASKVTTEQNIILKSDGKQVFTYCYGADVVVGMLYVLLCGNSGEAYNIGNNDCFASISDVAKEFAKQGNVAVEYHIEDNAKTGYVNVGHCITDNSKLYALGFRPQYDLKIGIANIIEQYKILNTEG